MLRKAAAQAYYRRWTGLSAFVAANAFAGSLLEEPLTGTLNLDGPESELAWLLTDARSDQGPAFSRLPLHG